VNKVRTLKQLIHCIRGHKKKGAKVVFTNGCFDLLHPGHIKILYEAKQKGDILIVGLNSDKSVKKIKGKGRPILNERARASILSAIGYVDYIVLFDAPTPHTLIRTLKPDYLVKGADWNSRQIVGASLVASWGGKVCRVKLRKGFSTTALIKKTQRGGTKAKRTR